MNFSDLASIGAGGVEATSIEAGLFAAPAVAEDTLGEQADLQGGETFAALLGLLVGPLPPPLPQPEVAVLPSGLALVAAEITPELMAKVTGGPVPMVADDRSLGSRETVSQFAPQFAPEFAPELAPPLAAEPVPVGDLSELLGAPVDGAALADADVTGDVAAVDVPTGAFGPLPFVRVQPSRVSLDSTPAASHPKPITAPPLPIDQPAPIKRTAPLAGPVAATPPAPTEPFAVLQGPATASSPPEAVGTERRATIDVTIPATTLAAPALAARPVVERDHADQAEGTQTVVHDPAVSPVVKPAAIVQAVAQVEAATRAAVGPAPGAEPAVSPSPITPPAQAPTGSRGETFEHDDAPGQSAVPHPVQALRAVAVVSDVPVLFSDALHAPMPVSPAAAAWLPAAGEIDELPDLTPQIIRSVRMQVAGEVGHARVHLRPEHLGELVVDLRVDQGDVIATIRSDVREVREWIQARSEELRSALGASGLTLVHVSVNEREQQQQKGKGQEAEVKDEEKGRKSKNKEDGRVFEIAA